MSLGFDNDVNTKSGIPAPGYSTRVNDPELLAAVKKNKKASRVFGVILIPLPLIGFIVYALVSKSMELKQAAIYGGIISGVFLLFALIGKFRSRASAGYDGTVTDKKKKEKEETNGDNTRYYTEYITYVETTEGKKKRIVERSGSRVIAYNYLNIGDRFRYHPQFNFQYEKYDKSTAPYIGCIACGTENPVEADHCKRCNTPLLK